MTKRPTLTDLTSLTSSSAINTLSQNWDSIQEAFDNTLSLDGSTPNALNADLDLNGNALLNVGTIDVENLTLDGQTVTDLATVPEWRGAWVTATSYTKNDLVKANGNVYICLVTHTSGTFSTDLTALKWELMVSKGDSGAGTGDLVSTNNLSDVSNVATARSNLGLGTVATESTVPVAKGGTGATDVTTARTNLGLGTVATESIVPLAKGGTGAALVDPNADRILFWDDGASSVAFLEAGNGLTISGTTLTSYAVDFTSSESNLAASTTYTFAHGLGVVPRDFRAYLRCASAINGYSTDQHVLLTPYQDSSAQGVGLWADATNVYVRTAGAVATFGPSGYNALTAGSSWKVYVRAWE